MNLKLHQNKSLYIKKKLEVDISLVFTTIFTIVNSSFTKQRFKSTQTSSFTQNLPPSLSHLENFNIYFLNLYLSTFIPMCPINPIIVPSSRNIRAINKIHKDFKNLRRLNLALLRIIYFIASHTQNYTSSLHLYLNPSLKFFFVYLLPYIYSTIHFFFSATSPYFANSIDFDSSNHISFPFYNRPYFAKSN